MDIGIQPAGHAERRTVRVPADAHVEDLRAAAAAALSIEASRVRIVFLGRVLRDGESLHAAGVSPGAVVHISERSPAEMAAASAPRPSDHPGAAPDAATSNAAALHAALQHAGTILGGLTAGMAFLAPPEPPAEALRSSAASRAPSRPAPPARHDDAPPVQASTLAGGPVVRGATLRVLANLDDEMLRLSTLDGAADVLALPPGTPSAADVRLCPDALQRNLAAFERVHATAAEAAALLRRSLAPGQQPAWHAAHLLAGMLVDLPTLSLVERRLLAAVRAHPASGAPVLPPHVDVPAFLDRTRPPSDLVEPPE